MQTDIPLEMLTRKGEMTRSPFQMTPAELKTWQQESKTEAKEYLFSIGQPLVYERDGRMIAEFADGRIENLR
jgi:hypothetical protein